MVGSHKSSVGGYGKKLAAIKKPCGCAMGEKCKCKQVSRNGKHNSSNG